MSAGLVIIVRKVPGGFKSTVAHPGERVHTWDLCEHFHKTEGAARACARKKLRNG